MEDTDVMSVDKLQRERTGHFTKYLGERSTDQRHESGRPQHKRTGENVTTVAELVGLLSQKGQK